jgi:hypothetical protein
MSWPGPDWLDEMFGGDAEVEQPQHVCKHCKLEISAWSLSMDGNHAWKHANGGYMLCIIDGVRPGTHAEP